MRIDEFVTLLEAVKPASSGYQARCPAHTDHKPSLSVSEGEDGRILVKDHAGCTGRPTHNSLGNCCCPPCAIDRGTAALPTQPAAFNRRYH